MRRVLYAALLIPLFFVPLNRVNVADLLPIEAVAVYMDGGQVVLETDTEHKGFGENAEKAFVSLKQNTPAVVYLETAEYLLVAPDAVEQVEILRPHLKPSVKVCVWNAAGKVKDAAKYLEIHRDLPTLKTWKKENTKK
ncbi:MAG: hypothetical protein IJ403_11460 [Oscillospiraceae bacterium]|nr:hypothetical protein [Oscillospiraceae bacterium]